MLTLKQAGHPVGQKGRVRHLGMGHAVKTQTQTQKPSTMTQSNLKRELLAEFLGTFVLIALGAGVVAQVVLGKKTERRLPFDQHSLGLLP